VQPQPFPSAKYVAVSANQTLDFEAICVLTTDLPDSTVHRPRRYRRTTTSKQASKQNWRYSQWQFMQWMAFGGNLCVQCNSSGSAW